MSSRFGRFIGRIGAIAGKEVLHIRRDPRTLYLALVMPVVMLLLFGFGVSFDIDRLPLAIDDRDRSAASRALCIALTAHGELEAVEGGEAPEEAFRRGEALGAVVIPAGYGQALARGEVAEVQLIVDGSDGVVANQILSKVDAVARDVTRELAGAIDTAPPLTVKLWTRYNPAGRSAVFIVPGLSAYLLAMGAVLLTALAIAGEWERGSMEQLFAAPVGRVEIVVGKLLPYLALGMVELLLVLGVGMAVFDVPMRGSPPLVFLLGFFFLSGMLGQGLLISVLAKNQLVATQAGSMSAILPSLLLSGMLFPIENMPPILQWVSTVVPARYLVHALRGLLLKGSGIDVLWRDLLALVLFTFFVVSLAVLRFRRRVA